MVRGVTGEQRACAVHLEREAAPERPVPIAEPTGAEVSGGSCRDAQGVDDGVLPPVQLDDLSHAPAANVGGQSERHDPGRIRVRARDLPNGELVEMVVVVVREQHDVERR